MIAGTELFGHPATVFLEVDPAFRWIRRESWTVQHHQFERPAKFRLSGPGNVAVTNASVHENQPLHAKPP
jgi:hypothetical protein